MTAYITTDQFKDTTQLTGYLEADFDIQAAILASSKAIDKVCDRRFDKDEDAAQVRYYSSGSSRDGRVDIDDVIDVTSIKSDNDGSFSYPNVWTVNSDYILDPLNAPADDEPWTAFLVHPNSQFTPRSIYPRNIQVTGQFGWPEVPDAIVEATTILTGRLVKTAREAQFGVFTFGDQAFQIARNDPTVSMLIGPYRRHRFAVA